MYLHYWTLKNRRQPCLFTSHFSFLSNQTYSIQILSKGRRTTEENGQKCETKRSKRKQVMQLSSSECITWFAVTLTVCVAIVTVNLLSIILFIKNRSLRTRAMYLVINLTIVDTFVGGFSHFFQFRLYSL